jgi:hypothetical protein
LEFILKIIRDKRYFLLLKPYSIEPELEEAMAINAHIDGELRIFGDLGYHQQRHRL